MFSKFLISPSGWVYANLAKMAALNGGPQNLLNKVLKTGRVQGIVGLLVVEAVGAAVTWGAMNGHSIKNGKHGRNIITNTYVACPECGTCFEHRSGPSLGCPNCNWSITDQEFEDGEYEDGIFGYEL
jgi:ribosomal protein L37AE/L43A